MLRISDIDQFFECFDVDKDGILNEDEQILIVSTIKEKMASMAKDLNKMQEYVLFKELMKQIRKIENDINCYQNQMRMSIYKHQKKQYKEIGEDVLDEFYQKQYQNFKQLEQYKEDRRNTLTLQHLEEFDQLEEKLGRPGQSLKIKPKKKLREYQTQEKLVAIEERIEEALDFRKELNKLEVSEAQRVQNTIQQNADYARKQLQAQQIAEVKQLEMKLENEENKMTIQLKRDYDITMKKINLHTHDINRLQAQAQSMNLKKGQFEGDLVRFKMNLKNQNEIIKQSKKIQKTIQQVEKVDIENSNCSSPTKKSKNTSPRKSSKSYQEEKIQDPNDKIKKIIQKGNIQRFFLRQEAGSDRPINKKQQDGDLDGAIHCKIDRYLVKKNNTSEQLPSLTELYSNNLNEKENFIRNEDQFSLKQKIKRRQYINQIMYKDVKIV